MRQPFASLRLGELGAQVFAEFRDRRLQSVGARTVNGDLTALSQVFKVARSEWGIPVPNYVAGIRRPRQPAPRDRRLRPGEFESLIRAADCCRTSTLRWLVEFAIETAMRRGEILGIAWEHVDWDGSTLRIPRAKTGPRTIPLSPQAIAVLHARRSQAVARPFPLTLVAFKLAWARTVKRSKLSDLHFHDLRHEAISRFFERGLSIPEVALISGHKDPRMLFRYTHLRAEDVAAKLASQQTRVARLPAAAGRESGSKSSAPA
jgi:integrase